MAATAANEELVDVVLVGGGIMSATLATILGELQPDMRFKVFERLDDIAIAYEAGDAPAARELVHRLAPAAVRKLGRRVLTDKLIRAQADRFIDRYHGLLRGAVRRGDDGLTAVNLLGSAAGRAFLLLDAAVGDRG